MARPVAGQEYARAVRGQNFIHVESILGRASAGDAVQLETVFSKPEGRSGLAKRAYLPSHPRRPPERCILASMADEAVVLRIFHANIKPFHYRTAFSGDSTLPVHIHYPGA